MFENKKAFLFDMDGLLVDTESIHLKMWHQLFLKKGIAIDLNVLKSTIGVSEATEKRILQEALGADNHFFQYLTEKEAMMEAYLAKEGLPVKAGARELLTYLQREHKTVVLVSSSYETKVDEYLRLAGLNDLIHNRVCGDDVKEAKPSPEIYLLALKKYHLKAEACIVFEDSKNGIAAADQAGIDVIGIPDLVDISDLGFPCLKAIYPDLHHVLKNLEKEHENEL